MNKKGFTLIELLAVIVILAIIALITTPIVLNLINQSKEAANKRSVEAYAKAVEYAVAQYEYEHNGELPADFNTIKDNVEYSNSDVKCNVAINCDNKGSVELTGCQVGSYTNHYYKYSSTAGNKGAEEDDTNPPSGNESVNNTSCSSGGSSSGGSSSNPYETDFSGNYVYDWYDDSYDGYEFDDGWSTTLNSTMLAYLRKNNSSNTPETCGVFSGGTVCLTSSYYNSDYSLVGSYGSDFEDAIVGEYDFTNIVTSGLKGYAKAKAGEMLSKGASLCNVYDGGLYCSGDSNFCNIDSNQVSCNDDRGVSCLVDSEDNHYCSN